MNKFAVGLAAIAAVTAGTAANAAVTIYTNDREA
jgi:hypothetical protein